MSTMLLTGLNVLEMPMAIFYLKTPITIKTNKNDENI